jgi:hypothetical protein
MTEAIIVCQHAVFNILFELVKFHDVAIIFIDLIGLQLTHHQSPPDAVGTLYQCATFSRRATPDESS